MFKHGDKITRKDGKWGDNRFATVIGYNSSDNEIMARFRNKGKYFVACADKYIKIEKDTGS